jgi:uncharacterized protein (TIGR02611 family)
MHKTPKMNRVKRTKPQGKFLRSDRWRQVRKIAVLILGGLIVLAGIVMLVLPGPAFLVIPAGFALIATEHKWARRWGRTTLNLLKKAASRKERKRFVHENSLALVLAFLFALFLAGQVIAGYLSSNLERELRNESRQTLLRYTLSGHCIEATFENWESEFLQMWALVLLTSYLHQRGAADSKELNQDARGSESRPRAHSPWPVRRGGWILKVYEQSLSLALLGLFCLSFVLHAIGGAAEFNEERVRLGAAPISLFRYVVTSRFWFESFQNWQSEFLAVGVLLVLSIFLRQKGSPESKPVNAPHLETG